jgi:protein farnesyltransferase subunit beta
MSFLAFFSLCPSPCAEMVWPLVLRAIDTIMQWQHPDGGFGGGPGQAAHLLPTYAAVCSLAIAGGPGPGGGWDQIDRCAMRSYRCDLPPNASGRDKLYKWYMSLKQPDGSFIVSTHGEVDVRYALRPVDVRISPSYRL